jgi:predicted negative regulator of RcsB-dependent stress response
MNIPIKAKSILLLAAIVWILPGIIYPTFAESAEQRPQPGSEELGKITTFLEVMSKYIHITREFYGIADDQERAAAFAIMEIKTVYEQSGNRQGAIKELTSLLAETNNRTIRNIIRFQLMDLYKQSNDTAAAMESLRAIIEENLR